MQRGLDSGTRVGGGGHSSWPQGVEQAGESRGERRKWGRYTRLAPQGNLGLHLVRHGEGATAEVASQDKEGRKLGMPMPPR